MAIETVGNTTLPADVTTAEGDTVAKQRRSVKYWQEAINEQVAKYKTYNDVVDNIEDSLSSLERLANDNRSREMNIMWANMEVLKGAVFAKAPIPAVTERHKKRKNPAARHAVEILERSLGTAIEYPKRIEDQLITIRDDFLAGSRGVLWLDVIDDEDTGKPYVCFEQVDREDFLHSPGRTWYEVWWVARQYYPNEDEATEQYGAEKADMLEFERVKEYNELSEGDNRAKVWVVWDKSSKQVLHVPMQGEEFLKVEKAPFRTRGFFPCPKPAYGPCQRRSLVPVPIFVYIRDQLEEINDLTERISALSAFLRVVGWYAAGADELSEAIELALDKMADEDRAILHPVKALGMGTVKVGDMIDWLPIDMVAKVVEGLITLRKQVIMDVYEVSGLSDIMRGATDAQETLGAQQLKSQYGSIRVKDLQEQMVRLIRDAMEMSGEIMAEHFGIDQLLVMAQYDELRTNAEVSGEAQQIKAQIERYSQDPMLPQKMQDPKFAQQAKQMAKQMQDRLAELQEEATVEAVGELLEDEKMLPFVIDIETDSTIRPDEDMLKQRTNEFLTAFSTAAQQLFTMVSTVPQTAEFAAEMLLFSLKPYRIGRTLEGAIEDMVEKLVEMPQQQDPKAQEAQQKAQIEQVKAQKDMQIEQQKAQSELAKEKMRMDAQSALKQQDNAHKAQIEQMKVEQDDRDRLDKTRLQDRSIDLESIKLLVELLKQQSGEQQAIRGQDELKSKIMGIAEQTVDPATAEKIGAMINPPAPQEQVAMEMIMQQQMELRAEMQSGFQALVDLLSAEKEIVYRPDGMPGGVKVKRQQAAVQ